MKLWMSGELEYTVAEEFRIASIAVEDFINGRVSQLDAKDANAWDVIAIIRDDDNFDERIRFSKKDGMDLRLRIPYKEFVSSTPANRKHLIIDMLERSLEMILDKFPSAFDMDQLQSVLLEAKENA